MVCDPDIEILVIEDDPSINDVVCTRLKREGYTVTPAFSGTEAKMLLEASGSDRHPFNLVITDLMLPGMIGEEVVSQIRRSNENTPIIVISARTSAADKVDLLSLGADDYLVKPFDLDELVARVKVQLRRLRISTSNDGELVLRPSASATDETAATITFGPIVIDPERRTVSVASAKLSLTRTEFDMLHVLACHPRRVFSKQELYEHVWNEPYPGQENSVNAHLSNVRSKLRAVGADGYIQTVWGIGFKLDEPAA